MTQLADPPVRVTPTPGKPKKGDPVEGLPAGYPPQGCWTEEDYLSLDDDRRLMVEFTDGFVEVLPMVTILHQQILVFLFDLLRPIVKARGLGKVHFAPLPTRFRVRKWREPDLMVFGPDQVTPDRKYPTGAKLVMEIISPDDRSQERDYIEKRADYAKAGIVEYWLIDPQLRVVMVLHLVGGTYAEHGTFRLGERATSASIPGLAVDVTAMFEAGDE